MHECEDGLDNDNDGFVDYPDDLGCSSSDDDDENDAPLLTPIGRCVIPGAGNSFVAVFDYVNDNAAKLSIPVGADNMFAPAPANRDQPIAFESGRRNGILTVNSDGSPVTWTLKAPGAPARTATVSKNSTLCPGLEPLASCVEFDFTKTDGTMIATVGYNNPNAFTVKLPAGPLNSVSPGNSDQGQPLDFFAGLNPAAFTLSVSQETALIWTLTGKSVTIDKKLPLCPASENCVTKNLSEVKGALDAIALAMAKTMIDSAVRLANLPTKNHLESKAGKADEKRARDKANRRNKRVHELLLRVPAVNVMCPQAGKFCAQVDRFYEIYGLQDMYFKLFAETRRIAARYSFKKYGDTKRLPLETREIKRLFKQAKVRLKEIPRFAVDCK